MSSLRKVLPAMTGAVLAVLLLTTGSARGEGLAPGSELVGHKTIVSSVAFSPDGTRLASLSEDGVVMIWDVAKGKSLATFEGARHERNRVQFQPNGQVVYTLGGDSNLLAFDLGSMKEKKPIALAVTGSITGFDLSPAGKQVAVSFRGGVAIFDLDSGAKKSVFPLHPQHETTAVAYAPRGDRLATVGSDNTALVADATTGAILQTVPLKAKGELVAFSTSGNTLFTTSDDRTLRSTDIATVQSTVLLDVGMVALSMTPMPDGKSLLLAGVERGGPSLFALQEKKLAERRLDCEDRVMTAATSADGTRVAGGGHEGKIYLWQIK